MIVDRELVRRLEASAAKVSLATVDAYCSLDAADPARAVAWEHGALIAFGPGRYVNRAVGITLDDVGDDRLDQLEAFFTRCGVPPSIEVASWCPPSLLERLVRRGYAVSWFRNVYAMDLDEASPAPHPHVGVREVVDGTLDEWLQLLASGNEITSVAERTVSDEYGRAEHALAGSTDFVAELDGVPHGCGSLVRADGIGWLGGAATEPAGRRRGVQTTLLRHRMAVARRDGCDVVASTARPPGDSARNLSRLGFTLAYAQAVMTRP
ncbi:MAG: GNAT family N-acetyltransferase [Ilumatobacteraceae bacterium]